MSRAKFGLSENDVSGTGLLEALELGIAGKQLLWRALASAAEISPALRGLDSPNWSGEHVNNAMRFAPRL